MTRTIQEAAPDSLMGIGSSLFNLIKKNLRFLFIIGLLSVAGSVTWVLMIPNFYRSQCTVLPAEASSGTFSLLSQITGMSGLASGGSTETYLQLYPVIARSRTILVPLMDMEYNGRPIWAVLNEVDDLTTDTPELREEAIFELQNEIGATADLRQGLFQLSYPSEDKVFAAFVVNTIVENMDKFFRKNLRFEANKNRTMIEARLDSVATTLSAAEQNLMEFQLRNRTSQFSPSLSMQEGRYRRKVDIQSTVFIELNRQLELAKIEEEGGVAVMKILDEAVPPFKKAGPARALRVIFVVLGCQILGLAYCRYRR